MNVGNRIKELRIKQNLSNSKLASLAGLSQPVMNKLENGSRNPDIPTIEKICSALGITLKEFFDDGTEPTPIPEIFKVFIEENKDLTPEQLELLSKFLKTLK